MKVTAKLNYLGIAPRKIRLLADLIRGKKMEEARNLLDFTLKRGKIPLRKLLDSAVASAKHNYQLDEKNLYISEIKVDEGPKLKRWRARARGRAMEIQKKTSHITLVLEGKKIKIEEISQKVKEEKKEEKKAEKETKKQLKPKAPTVKKPERTLAPVKSGKERRSWKKIFRRKAF